MSDVREIGGLIERALLADAAAAGCPIRIESAQWQRWASRNFAGAQGRLLLAAGGDRWLAGLPEVKLAIQGHLVAELVVSAARRADSGSRVSLELLTVETRA